MPAERGICQRPQAIAMKTAMPVQTPASRDNRRLVPAAAFILAGIAVFLIYYPTIDSPFHFDDFLYVANNEAIRSLKNFVYPSGTRYVTYLSFALNYSIGGVNTTGYHAVNIAIHALNSFLVYALVSATLRTPVMTGGRDGKDGVPAWLIGLFSSLLFAAHPVQTEAVTYVTQRFASLATFFYLCSLVSYLKWRLYPEGGAVFSRRLFYIASLASAVLAMKTKEISFTLPVVIALYEAVFFNERPLRDRFFYLIPHLCTLLIVPGTVLAAAYFGAHSAGVSEQILATQVMELREFPRYYYLMTEFTVIPRYIGLLLFPAGQNLYYDLPFSRSFFEPRVLISFIFLLALFLGAIVLFIRARSSGNRLLVLAAGGIIWFFITISVESSVIPIRDAMFEHRMYLPNAGGCVALVSFVLYLSVRAGGWLRPGRAQIISSAVLLAAVSALGTAAYMRNRVWLGDNLWKDTVKKSPHSAFARINLAYAYSKEGRFDLEEAELKKAVGIAPGYFQARKRLGLYYYKMDRFDEAMAEFEAAKDLEPDDADLYIFLGDIRMGKGSIQDAIKDYELAVSKAQGSFDAYARLAKAHEAAGDKQGAINDYQILLKLAPNEEYKNAVRLKINELGSAAR